MTSRPRTSPRPAHPRTQRPALIRPERAAEAPIEGTTDPVPARHDRSDAGPDSSPDRWSETSPGAGPAGGSVSPTGARTLEWPNGPLDAAERAFGLLTRAPAPLAFDCRAIPGLRRRAIVDLAELRRLLVSREPPPARVVDAVWRELVLRSRRDGPAWVVAAVGMALPGLRRRAGLLARGWNGDPADMDSELLLGFLERLAGIDVDAANICSRLIDAGARAVRRSRRHTEAIDISRPDGARSLPPARPWDHPDLVLARAVRAAVISPEDAGVIGETRLGNATIGQLADRLHMSVAALISARQRAELRLTEAIQAGELRWTFLPDQ